MKDFVLRDQVHHGAAGAKRGERQSAANGFGQANDVRFDAKKFAGTAPGEFGAGLHFVEDEQRVILGAEVAQALEKTRLRTAEANVHQNRFENDGRDLAGIVLEAALDAGEIVEDRDDGVGERGLWNTGAGGDARGCVGIAVILGFGLYADESGVMQTVISAFEFQDLVAAGGGARDAASVHGHFRAAGAETNHFDGIAFANFFGKFPFLIVRHAKGGAPVQLLFNGFDHGGMAMAGH